MPLLVLLRWLFLANVFLFTFYTGLVMLPMVIRFDYNASIREPLKWYNVFDGEGAVGDTWLFYGVCRSASGESWRSVSL